MSTISVKYQKLAIIYDNWKGPYFAPMNWKKVSSLEHEWTWLSSLDYRNKYEAAVLAEYGNIDQSATQNILYPYQRPALFILENHDKYYGSI